MTITYGQECVSITVRVILSEALCIGIEMAVAAFLTVGIILAISDCLLAGSSRPDGAGILITLTELSRGRAPLHASGEISVISPSKEGRASDVNVMGKCLNRGKCRIAAATAS